MRVLISGYCGKMGQHVAELAAKGICGAEIVAGVDAFSKGGEPVPVAKTYDEAVTDVDVIIDFSHVSNTKALCDFAVKNKIPLVIATTGQTPADYEIIEAAGKEIPIFHGHNFSMGIGLILDLVKKVAAKCPDMEVEIVEKHHNRKVDAPSGTAVDIANAIIEVRPELFVHNGRAGHGKREPNEIGIHAVRMGNIVGDHEVIFGNDSQSLSIHHIAYDRSMFAEGALYGAQFIQGKPAGLYEMKDMLQS